VPPPARFYRPTVPPDDPRQPFFCTLLDLHVCDLPNDEHAEDLGDSGTH